jgi:hypothetical protein
MGTLGTETVLVSDVVDCVDLTIGTGVRVRSLDNLSVRILGSLASQALYVSRFVSLDAIAGLIAEISNKQFNCEPKFDHFWLKPNEISSNIFNSNLTFC